MASSTKISSNIQTLQLLGARRSCGESSIVQLYILNELTFLANSMRKTDIFITLVQQLFDDIVIRNEFSANEHPHTIAGLQLSLTDEFCQFWIDNRRK